MNTIFSEKDYPIQTVWIFKSVVGLIIALVILVFFLFLGVYSWYLMYVLIATPIYIVVTTLRKNNFHYALEEKFLTIKQGVISKQERHIPYGVIQNIFVKQDLLDRLFGITSVTIENASAGGAHLPQKKSFFSRFNSRRGSSG